MPLDDEFDDLMATADGAMAIVTVDVAGERSGCLVGFSGQTSIVPRRYAVWLSRANHTQRIARRADHLGVHLLSQDDRDLARLFGTETGDEVDKFDRCEWELTPQGVPVLLGTTRRMVLRRTGLIDGEGDHVCFLGAPVAVTTTRQQLRPLRLSDVSDLEAGHAPDERPSG